MNSTTDLVLEHIDVPMFNITKAELLLLNDCSLIFGNVSGKLTTNDLLDNSSEIEQLLLNKIPFLQELKDVIDKQNIATDFKHDIWFDFLDCLHIIDIRFKNNNCYQIVANFKLQDFNYLFLEEVINKILKIKQSI
jgi:hypothetical protein